MVSEAEIKEQAQQRRRQYEADLEPLVAPAAPHVHDANRALLGRVRDLVPSRTDDVHAVPDEDVLWYRALGAVAERYGLTYELVSEETGRYLWLIRRGRSHG